MRIVNSAGDESGSSGEIRGSMGFFAEVKTVSPKNKNLFDIVLNGAVQARNQGGGLYGSVLALDTNAWIKLTKDQRQKVLATLGSAQLLVIDGLNALAAQRLRRARRAVGGGYQEPPEDF